MGIVTDNTTNIITTIIIDTSSVVIRNTAVTSITAYNIVTSAVKFNYNNNIYGPTTTLFTTGSIGIIINIATDRRKTAAPKII